MNRQGPEASMHRGCQIRPVETLAWLDNHLSPKKMDSTRKCRRISSYRSRNVCQLFEPKTADKQSVVLFVFSFAGRYPSVAEMSAVPALIPRQKGNFSVFNGAGEPLVFDFEACRSERSEMLWPRRQSECNKSTDWSSHEEMAPSEPEGEVTP
jgi:hypothetical protein